jgi:hypothetical protein
MKKTITYLILVLLLSYGVRYVLHEGIRKNKYGIFDKFNTVFLKQNNYNTLFIGSSRAECHFNPQIFDSITGLNSYNIGMQGSNNAFTYSVLKSYLVNSKTPETIIMNLDFHFSNESSDTIYAYPRYFPYLSNPVLYEELKKRDKRFPVFRYFPFFSLAHMGDKYLNSSIRGYLNRKSAYDELMNKGNGKILPLNYTNLDTLPQGKYKGSILKENLDYLDSIVQLSKKLKSKLYFVISPTYVNGSTRITNLEEHLQHFRNFANNNNIHLWDFTNDELCYKKELFADFYHMKGKGCDAFTLKFSNSFKAVVSAE